MSHRKQRRFPGFSQPARIIIFWDYAQRVICPFSNEGLKNEKRINEEYQPRFLNNGGRGLFDRRKKIGKRRQKAARKHWFQERTRGTTQLIRLIRGGSSGSENRVTGTRHLDPDSQTFPQEKKDKRDHRLLNRSKGGNPKGQERKETLLKREEFEIFSIHEACPPSALKIVKMILAYGVKFQISYDKVKKKTSVLQ